LTEKQKRFADEYLIDLNATRAIMRLYNFELIEDPLGVILESVAVLVGDFNIYRKQAALLLLKALLTKDFYTFLLEDDHIYPVSREDNRVRKWKKEVLKIRHCEQCGSLNDLEAHHIIKWADYPLGRISVENGMCLCLECHIKEHENDQSIYLMRGKLDAKVNS